MKRDKGYAIVFCLLILMGISSLGVCFARLTMIEREVARNYSNKKQAMLLADSGIDFAILRLREEMNRVPYTDINQGWLYQEHISVPVENAKRPSLYKGDINISGTPYGYSGFANNTNYCYSLKIIDANGLLNLNDPNPMFHKILHNFFLVMGIGENRSVEIIKSFNKRRKTPFKTVEDLLTRSIVTQAEFEKIKDFFTIVSWVDYNAVKPGMLNRPKTEEWFEARSPIDLNSAPKEILIAVLSGISGDIIGEAKVKIDMGLAKGIVNKILRRRERSGGFKSWNEFDLFLQSTLPENTSLLIFANANPNVNLNKQNPDAFLYRKLDKLDLKDYTTEFCLGPMEYFHITSLGRVRQGNVVLGEAKTSTVVRLFKIQRQSFQKEFEEARRVSENHAMTSPNPVSLGESKKSHQAIGTIFRRNPYAKCDYWENVKPLLRWSDGAASTEDKPIVTKPLSMNKRGIAFFFKPGKTWLTNGSYILYESATPTPERLEILTRIFYENKKLMASRTLTLQRGNVIDNIQNLPRRRSYVRILRGVPIYKCIMEKLAEKGTVVYIQNLRTWNEGEFHFEEKDYANKIQAFSSEYARRIYLAVCDGNPLLETVQNLRMDYRLDKYKITGSGMQLVSSTEKSKYLSAKLSEHFCGYIFKGVPESYCAKRSPDQPERARDVGVYPIPPIYHPYRYSRMEKEIDISIEKRKWYYIELTWEDVGITKFLVKESKGEHEAQGIDRKGVSGGPLNIWRIEYYIEPEQKFPVDGTFFNAELGKWKRYPDTSTFIGSFKISEKSPVMYALRYYTAYIPPGTELLCSVMKEFHTKPVSGERIDYEVILKGSDYFQTPILEDITIRLMFVRPKFIRYASE